MFVPVTEIAPVAATEARSICPPLTVKLESLVVPPTAPEKVTEPVSASSVSAYAPSMVEPKMILPSVVLLLLSLSTVALAPRVTASSNVMFPSADETFAVSVVAPLEFKISEALPPMVRASPMVMEDAETELPAALAPVGPVVAVPIVIVPDVVNLPISALLRLSAVALIVIATDRDGATFIAPVPALTLAVDLMSKAAAINVMLPLFDVIVTLPPIVSFPVPLLLDDLGESASNTKLWAPFVPVMLALIVRWRPACR